MKWLALLCLLATLAGTARGATYYVDSSSGNDGASGTDPASAWRSLEKVNGQTFQPADSILFKCGDTWRGQLNPKGSGAEDHPCIIDKYGDGKKPIIDGGGAEGNGTVYLSDQSWWDIRNLEITDDASSGGDRRGILLTASRVPGNIARHLHVDGCFIHNIKGIVSQGNSGKGTGGILVEDGGEGENPTRMDDVVIENCVITTVDDVGIATVGRGSGSYPGTPGWEARKFTHLIIRNNRINDVAKNAMIIRYTDDSCVIEHNVCYDTAFRAKTGNTIFSSKCLGTVFQFNEGYLNRATGGFDGSLYDADLESPHCVFQYSYSHDNKQGLFWQCTNKADEGVIVRYNISQNDKGAIFCMNYPNTSTYVYNNTVYIPANLSPRIIDEKKDVNKTYYFYNNIIYNMSSTATYEWKGGSSGASSKGGKNSGGSGEVHREFDSNVFFGMHPHSEPKDAHKLTSDPMLVAPGTGKIGLDTLDGYKLQAGSPCVGSGRGVENNGGVDFWGNKVAGGSGVCRGAGAKQ